MNIFEKVRTVLCLITDSFFAANLSSVKNKTILYFYSLPSFEIKKKTTKNKINGKTTTKQLCFFQSAI